MKTIACAARNVLILVLSLLLSGCAAHHLPTATPDLTYQSSRTKSVGNLKVTVAVLGQDECQQVFGLPMLDKGVQPLWVHIDNQDDVPYIFLPISVDPNYFPPLEVAFKFYSRFSPEDNRKLDAFLRAKTIGKFVEPHHELSGFVFANVDLGAKYLRATLIGPGRLREFDFFLPVPGGLKADYEEVPFAKLFDPEKVRSVDDAQLRTALEEMPCCVTDEAEKAFGDPLNLVLIGEIEDLWSEFTRRGWDVTESIYAESIEKTVKSFLFGSRYRYSPVSPLYSFGRRQDFAMQKVRETIDARNHLRLWLAPLRYEGKPVWVGQISRDVGVRFTTKTWNLTTHQIDADLDEARDYLVQDLLVTNSIARLGYLKGVGPATTADNRTNLTGDGYFTDGLRAVMVLSNKPVPILEMKTFPWEWPPTK
jgi:hypothetical protein